MGEGLLMMRMNAWSGNTVTVSEAVVLLLLVVMMMSAGGDGDEDW